MMVCYKCDNTGYEPIFCCWPIQGGILVCGCRGEPVAIKKCDCGIIGSPEQKNLPKELEVLEFLSKKGA